jgi:hypothetical protein
MPNLVTTAATTVGALNSGSIAAGFGAIDNGTSNIRTGGLISIDADTDANDNTADGSAGRLAIGASGDLTLYHNTNSYIVNKTGNLILHTETDDADILFTGEDGASGITALTLDMSAGGYATFNAGAIFDGVVDITNATDASDNSGDTGALRTEGGASIAKKLYVGTTLNVGDAAAFASTVSCTVMNVSGDTAANQSAGIGRTAAEGIIVTGKGTTNDVTIKNSTDTAVITIATGTQVVGIPGSLDIEGDIDVNGTTNLDVVDIDGAVNMAANLTSTATGTFTTLNVTGDTAANTTAAIGQTAAEGLILTGQGSTNDITIKNDADETVLEIATGQPTIEITAGDLFFGTAGKGIVLGATSNSADNTLDDFEKGTFNAFVQDASGNSEQYYEQNGQYNRGQYTKTGNIVHFTINFYTSGSSGVTGSEGARVIGLPFASSGSGSVGTNGFVTAPYMSGMASGVASILTGRIIDGQTYILLDKVDGNGNTSNMTVTEWSQARCTLAGFYRTG